MKTKKEILEETIAAYTSETRAYEDGCKYLTSDGRMCAVGRCCVRPSFDWEGVVEHIRISGYRGDVESLLKPEYQGHEIEFWKNLQILHDCSEHWTKDGLSEEGKKWADSIRKRWDIPD